MLATVSEDGGPHATPVEIVVRDDLVFCWTSSSSVKARNVRREGRAALLCYKGNSFVLVRGPARALTADDPRYAEITRAFLEKYSGEDEYGNDTLVEITPQHVAERI